MADIEVVIKIDEKLYKEIIWLCNTNLSLHNPIDRAIAKGTPLEQMLDKAYEDFGKLKAGDSYILINGKRHSTDTAYAMDGIELFIAFITGREREGEE